MDEDRKQKIFNLYEQYLELTSVIGEVLATIGVPANPLTAMALFGVGTNIARQHKIDEQTLFAQMLNWENFTLNAMKKIAEGDAELTEKLKKYIQTFSPVPKN